MHAKINKQNPNKGSILVNLVMSFSNSEKSIYTNNDNFEHLALNLFRQQYKTVEVYRKFIEIIGVKPNEVKKLIDIPFLPIGFFKNYEIKNGNYNAELTFLSSSTTGIGQSKHLVKTKENYIQSFIECFNHFFGDYREYCYLALLPSYLERQGSSLIYMMDFFIKSSNYKESGYYLYNHQELAEKILENEKNAIPTFLFGVSFALLDFSEKYQFEDLKYTKIMDTGGMKGRRKEIVLEEFHHILKNAFGVDRIYSEYGMTELMSQAYSKENGEFYCPPSMRVFGRALDDPFEVRDSSGSGLLNIIDLNNTDSCAFIATDDLCNIAENGHFKILGRADFSDMRGCNVMVG